MSLGRDFWSIACVCLRYRSVDIQMSEHTKNVGYARVSTEEQNLDLQINALKAAGCDIIFTDQISGATHFRPGLNDAVNALGEGGKLVVWRLDRLGRSLLHLVQILDCWVAGTSSFPHSASTSIQAHQVDDWSFT
jgi:predicted site-specific integrase-resolvase